MNFLCGYNYKLEGSVAPGFEPVNRKLEEYFKNGMESRGQLCVYVGEEKVIGEYLVSNTEVILPFNL